MGAAAEAVVELLTGLTMNDGLFSLWKGQQAVNSWPCFFSGTRLSMSSTMSARLTSSSMKFCGMRGMD